MALAQIRPVWLQREATLDLVCERIDEAGSQQCDLVAFPEAILPGYPFWLERTDGATFNSPRQKEIFAHYADQAVQIEAGHLDRLCQAALNNKINVIVGCIERPSDRGGHSLYCTMVTIDSQGEIQAAHRKLVPTYEERLAWSPGDGHGLQSHSIGPFTVGGLNCWENWMPLARAALYALGVDLHVAIWPGCVRNTQDITRFIAMESRSYVASVCGLMSAAAIPPETQAIVGIRNDDTQDAWANGGSCIAAPDGSWLIPPMADVEKLIVADLDHRVVLQERQNFDPAGHYGRPDVTELRVNRQRQSTVKIVD